MRLTSLVVSAASALVLGACTFDPRPADGAVVTCQDNSECPTGTRCALGRCVARNDGDADAPVLSAMLSASAVRPGQGVTLVVEADEPLLAPPQVEVRGADRVTLLSSSDGVTFEFVAPAGQPDGLLRFFGAATDLAGNQATGVLLGTVLVDGTPPSTSGLVAPPRVAPDSSFVVTALFDEDVAAGATLVVDRADGSTLARVSSATRSIQVAFTVTVPAGEGSGELHLRLENVSDVVGNSALPGVGATVLVDADAPVVAPLGLQGRRFSRVPGFDQVVVPVSFTGGVSATVCLDADCQHAIDGQNITVRIDGASTEGVHTVAVRAVDEVGNRADVTEVVVFDFTPPTVIGAQVTYDVLAGCPLASVQAATTGTTVRAFFVTDEALSSPPEVSAGPTRFTVTPAAARSFSCTAVTDASSVTASLDAVLLDDVGNRTTASVGTLTVDSARLPAMTGAQRDAVLFRRVPFGAEETQGRPTFSLQAEPGAFPAGSAVVVSVDAQGSLVGGTLFPAADGSLAPSALSIPDVGGVYVRRFSRSCTADAAFERVQKVEWVGTTGPGSPVRVEEVLHAVSTSRRELVSRTFASELTRVDGTRVATLAVPQWVSVDAQLGPVTTLCASPFRRGALDAQGDEVQLAFANVNGDLLEVELPPSNGAPLVVRARFPGFGGAVCTWDFVRQRIVMASPSGTWEFDGVGWQAFPQPVQPGIVAVGFDEGSQTTLGVDFDGTWQWDGAQWTKLGATHLDADLQPPALAFDWTRGVMALLLPKFSGTYLSEWTGQAWTVNGTPTPLQGNAVIGGGPEGLLGFDGVTTLRWDGFGWPGVPGPTNACSATFTTGFGSRVGLVVTDQSLDACQRNGSGWDDRRRGVRTVRPDLTRAQAGYDPRTDHVLVYAQSVDGGWDSVWERTGVDWQNRGRGVDAGTLVSNSLLLSPDAGELWLFGGSSAQEDLFAWNGTAFTALPVTNHPTPARTGAMVTAVHRTGQVLLFSGKTLTGVQPNDTWLFTPATATWTRVATVGGPFARQLGALGYDPARNVVVLFGGKQSVDLGDTWEFSVATNAWTNVTAPGGPPPRSGGRFFFDAHLGQLLLVGGTSTETWGWDGTTWTHWTGSMGAPLEQLAVGADRASPFAIGPTHFSRLQFTDTSAAQRVTLPVSTVVPASATVVESRFITVTRDAQFASSSTPAFTVGLWNGWNWAAQPLDVASDGGVDVTATLTLDVDSFARSQAVDGLWSVETVSGDALHTDYVELRIRYDLP